MNKQKNIKTYLKNFFQGMRQALIVYPDQDYIRPARGDFKKDAATMRGDMAVLCNGLKKSVEKL